MGHADVLIQQGTTFAPASMMYLSAKADGKTEKSSESKSDSKSESKTETKTEAKPAVTTKSD